MFEWPKHTQTSTEVPHYLELIDFIDLRARASEASSIEPVKKSGGPKRFPMIRRLNHYVGAADVTSTCVSCKSGKHTLYTCASLRASHMTR